MVKAADINDYNMKLLNRLNSTKTTIPSIEEVRKQDIKNSNLKLRMSTIVREDPLVKLHKLKVQKKF